MLAIDKYGYILFSSENGLHMYVLHIPVLPSTLFRGSFFFLFFVVKYRSGALLLTYLHIWRYGDLLFFIVIVFTTSCQILLKGVATT